MDASSLLLLGFGLGLIHALDADHVMTVSSLNQRRFSIKQTIAFSVNWAVGHGGILLLVGLVFFGLGYELPAYVRSLAEKSVGLLLIALGACLLYSLHQESLVITTHSHGKLQHTHWHHSKPHSLTKHTPVLVGMLHGLAGSAPVLALIPALASGQLAIAYLLMFSLAVIFFMLLFGLALGFVQSRLQRVNPIWYRDLRRLLAGGAISMGCYWLTTTL